MNVSAEAERMSSDYAAIFDTSAASRGKTREFNDEAARLTVRGAELRRVAEGAVVQQQEALRGAQEAAARLEELRRVFSLLERIGAHVHRVDAAVAAMEAAVAEVTRQQTVTSLKSALSPVSRLFGLGKEETVAAPPFVRPANSAIDAQIL